MCGHAFLCPCHARALRASCDWFAFATCGVSPCHNVTMGMDMNEWLIAWIVLLKAVRAVCAPECF